MPDLIDLFTKWWKQIVALVVLSMLAVGIVVFLQPRQYLSVATAVPASSFAADKSKIFNDNIRELYSALGTPDDLDMILGTAHLDTVYLAVTDSFNLFDHYKLGEKGSAARIRAAYELKENTKVFKSDYGELKVKVWDTDKELAPQLANAIMNQLQLMHQNLQAAGNVATLSALRKARVRELTKEQMASDSAGAWVPASQQYDQLINEYQVMVDTKPAVLIIVENAKVSEWPDKPKRVQVLAVTALVSLLFALLLALVLERRKISKAV